MAEDNLKQKTKSGFLWTALNQFANYGLQFVVGIIMARLLSPTDYGITALPAVFLAVANVFIDSGFASAMIRKPELTEKDISTTFIYSFFVGIVCYIVLFLSAPYISNFYSTPVLTPLIRVTALTFIWGALATPQSIILQRKLDFKTIARISVTTKIIGSAFGIVLAFSGFGLWSLVGMNVISSLLNLLQMWFKVRWIPTEKWSKTSFKYLWGFGNKMMISILIDTLYTNIVPIFVGKFYSPAALGVYNRAQGYAQLPSVQFQNIVRQVTFPILSKMQNDSDSLARYYRKIIRVVAFVEFPIMMMLSALARPLVIVLVTDKWEGAVLLLQLMCFSMMWYPVHALNVNLLTVTGRSDYFLKLEIIKKSYGLLALVITLPISLVAVVLSGWVTNVLSLIVNTYYTGKIIGVTFFKQMGDLLPIFGLSLLMWCLIHGINSLINNYSIQIIIGGSVGMIFYVGVACLLKRPEIKDVLYMLKRKS